MFLEVEDDSSATWAAAGDVGPGAQQQSKSQMPTGPSPTCIFLNFLWANDQHGLTPLVLLHDHALRPAAGTWGRATRRRDGRRMPGHADSCLLGRWAASREPRATEQGTRKAGSNSKDQGALSNPRFGFCTTEHLCRSKLQFILLNYLACFFYFCLKYRIFILCID